MLHSILTDLAPTVSTNERAAVAAILSRYAVRLSQSREFNRQIKRLSPPVHQQLRAAKQKVLDRSDYFLTRLWRAVYEHVRYGLKVEVAAAQFRVSVADISLVLCSLTPRDRSFILRSRVQVERLQHAQRDQIIGEINRHARRLVRRLRFIARYDPGVDLQDLERELVVDGFSAFQRYEHFGQCRVGKILNYVRSSMRNRSINLINYYTSKSRATVSSAAGYRCPQCDHEFSLRPGVRGQCPKCQAVGELRQTEREFMVARVGLEDCLNNSNTDRLTDFEARTTVAPVESQLTEVQLELLLEQLPDQRVRQFFRLITCKIKGFQRWLVRKRRSAGTQPRLSALSLPELGRYACEYLGLSVDDLVRGLTGVIDADLLACHVRRCLPTA